MSPIRFSLLRVCTLFIALVSTGTAGASCADDLARAIRQNYGRRPTVDLDMGLPMNNSASPTEVLGPELQKTLSLPPSTQLIQTDLGPAAWSPEDFAAWQSLAPVLESEALALKEVNKIAGDDEYCSPGLFPYLCNQLRLSGKANRRALRDHPIAAGTHESRRFLISRDRMRAAIEAHEREDLLQFPWFILTQVEMHSLHAKNVMRTLAREALVRRLLIRDHEGHVSLGASLPEADRLLFASFPFAYPLLGFASRFPFAPADIHIIGDTQEYLTILSAPIDAGPRLRANFMLVLESATSVERGVAIRVKTETFRDDSAALDLARESLLTRLEGLANEFRRLVRQNMPIHVQFITLSPGEYELRMEGLGKLDQILFAYFVIDRTSH